MIFKVNPLDHFFNRTISARNVNIWLIFLMMLFFILVYQLWPWREWQVGIFWQKFTWLSHLYGLAVFEARNSIFGSLFLIPNIYAAIVFQWRGSLIVTALTLATVVPMTISLWGNIGSWITNISIITLPTFLILAIEVELALRNREKKHFAEIEQERLVYLSKIIEAQELERQRISQDLHDDSIQTLLATAINCERITLIEDLSTIKEKTRLVEKTLRSTIENLRKICLGLRPVLLDHLGLIPSLKSLIKQTLQDNNINAEMMIEGKEKKLSNKIELAVFRIVQEAVNNIFKHAEATNVTLKIKYDDGCFSISISDDGLGFKVPRRIAKFTEKQSYGLTGIQQRVHLLGGNLSINSKIGQGTSLAINIPYN